MDQTDLDGAVPDFSAWPRKLVSDSPEPLGDVLELLNARNVRAMSSKHILELIRSDPETTEKLKQRVDQAFAEGEVGEKESRKAVENRFFNVWIQTLARVRTEVCKANVGPVSFEDSGGATRACLYSLNKSYKHKHAAGGRQYGSTLQQLPNCFVRM